MGGNIAWIRPTDGSCPKTNSNFQLTLQASGYYDAAVIYGGNGYDFSPISVFQNYSTNVTDQYKYPGIYGLGCSLAPRTPGSGASSYTPTLVAICRNNLPYNYTLYGNTTLQYQTLAGKSGFAGPINVPQNAIVYMLIGNTIPYPTTVYTSVKFTYITGTNAQNKTEGPFYASDNYVTYVVGGSQPGFVSTQYFSPYTGYSQVYNEAQLYQLQACNCGTSPNIMCNATDNGNEYNLDVSPYIPIRTVPNYNQVPNFQQYVSCAIQPNYPYGTALFAGVPFTPYASFQGTGSYAIYEWSLQGLAPSSGLIISATSQRPTVIIYAVSTVTLVLSVFTPTSSTGIITCTSTFTVLSAAPIINILPSSNSITILSGALQVFDARGSLSPDNSTLHYYWQVLFGPVTTNYTLTSTNGSVTSFSAINTAPLPVTYVLQLSLTNDVTTVTEQINIFVEDPGSPYVYAPVESGPGLEPRGQCVQPSPPFQIVLPPNQPVYWIPFQTQPGTVVPPSQFQPLGAPGGLLPPSAYITPEEQTNAVAVLIVIVVVIVFAVFACIFGKQASAHLRPD
jgi:hypothetical protein